MSNQDNSQSGPTSVGPVRADFDRWVETFKDTLPINDPVAMSQILFVWHVAACSMFNFLITSLRSEPELAVSLTAAAKKELDDFFTSIQPTSH